MGSSLALHLVVLLLRDSMLVVRKLFQTARETCSTLWLPIIYGKTAEATPDFPPSLVEKAITPNYSPD